MHHGSTAAGGQLVFFMTNRLNNPAYGTHHDPERAYLPEQRMQVDSVDSPFDFGFVDVKVPASHTRGADAKHFTLSHYEKRVVAGPHPDAGAVAASALSALATPEPFADSIYACLGNHTGTSGEVVLLIHGSNESWSHAIKKAAQLTWDTSQISPAAAEGLPGDSTPGRRIALAFDWASAGHGITFTSHKDDRGINAAQDQLPVLLQILEGLMLRDQQEVRDELNAALKRSDKGSSPYPFLGEDLGRLLELRKEQGADHDTIQKDQGARASSNAEWTAACKQTAQQARRFKALHIVTHGMGSLVLQRGLSNALLMPGTAHSEEGLGACKPCANLLRSFADGGVRLTITLVTPEMDHASLNIMCNNLGSLCPINLYCTRSDNKGQAGSYSWGLPGSVGHKNHACHFYLHPAVKTIKLSGMHGHSYFARHEEVLQDLADIFAGRDIAERRLAVIGPDDTKCLTCSDRLRMQMAGGGAPMFKLMPHAAAALAERPAAAVAAPSEPAVAVTAAPAEPAAAASEQAEAAREAAALAE